LEFVGRTDQQVKVRGFRVELGEIEAALLRHPRIREAVVVGAPDPSGSTRLVAYVVVVDPEVALEIDTTRAFLAELLPEYMVPSTYVCLDALPLNRSGKIDRASLPDSEQARPELRVPFKEPRTDVEHQVADVWSDVLGVDKIGVDDNFFDLGGHSLLATQVVARLQRRGIAVGIADVFDHPTIAGLAALDQVHASRIPE
jgi:aryl carrier-like protein